MAILDAYNAGKMIETQLMIDIKSSLVDNLTDRMVDEFRERAEVEIRKEVEQLTLGKVEYLRDMLHFRDEVRVYCEWVNKKDEVSS